MGLLQAPISPAKEWPGTFLEKCLFSGQEVMCQALSWAVLVLAVPLCPLGKWQGQAEQGSPGSRPRAPSKALQCAPRQLGRIRHSLSPLPCFLRVRTVDWQLCRQ